MILRRLRKGGAAVWARLRRLGTVGTLRGAGMYINRILERMEDNHIFLSAAGIAFNALLCIIPIILLLLYVLGLYLDSASAIEAVDEYLKTLGLVPFQKERILTAVFTIVRDFSAGTHIAGLVGFLGLTYTASTLFAALRTVLNKIFHTKDPRNLVVSTLKDFAMLAVIGVTFISVTFLLNGATLVEGLGRELLGDVFSIGPLSWFVSTTASIVVTFLMLIVIFSAIPDIRLPFRAILLSSVVATVLWAMAKMVFGYYITNLWSIGRVYGSYAIVAAGAIWVYYSAVTFLLAAEVGQMYIERQRLRRLFSESELRALSDQLRAIDLPSRTRGRTSV